MRHALTTADRNRAAKAKTRHERTLFIAEMMSENRWVAANWWHVDLGAIWSLSRHTVRSYAADAHRLIAVPPEQREALRAQLVMRLHDIAARARKAKNVITKLPDFRSEIEATMKIAELLGLKDDGPVRHDAPARITFTFAGEDAKDSPQPPADGGDEGRRTR